MKKVIHLLSLTLIGLFLIGCGGTAIQNIDNSGTIDKKVSLKQVEAAIKKGAMRKNWATKKIQDGLLESRVNVRGKHVAVVNISYNTKGYKIDYKDSQGLKYDASSNTIHKNYNKWVHSLQRNIDYELAQIGIHRNTSAATAAPTPAPVVYQQPATVTPSTAHLKKSGEVSIEGKTIYVKSIIPYAQNAPVATNIKTECIIDKQLSEFIVSNAQANGMNIVVKDNIGKDDLELKVEIIDAVSRGGAFRGHNKYVTISGALVKGDKVYQSFKAARISGGGFWGAYKSSCAVLGRTVKALGNDVAIWLSSPMDGAKLGDTYLIRY